MLPQGRTAPFRSAIQVILCLCSILAVSGTGCGVEKNAASMDADKLQGTWQLVYQQMNGTKLPDEKQAEMFHGKMTFAGDKIRYTVELPGFDFEFRYVLHPDHQPKEIDLELTESPDKKSLGSKFYGIYVLENSTLRICHNKLKRPTGFSAEEGSHNVLVVLKRDNVR